MKTLSFALISALLLGASAIMPPVRGPPPVDSGCCCCDTSINKISCDRSIPADECVCAQVICPANAPTVWHGVPPPPKPTPPPAPKPTPTPDASLKPCCCCDIRINKTVCELRPAEDCFCAAVVCPSLETIFGKASDVPVA